MTTKTAQACDDCGRKTNHAYRCRGGWLYRCPRCSRSLLGIFG